MFNRPLALLAALTIHSVAACQLKVDCRMNGRPCNSPRNLDVDGNCFAEVEIEVSFRNTRNTAVSLSLASLSFPSFDTIDMLDSNAGDAAFPADAIVPAGVTVNFKTTYAPVLVCGDNVPSFDIESAIETSTNGCMARSSKYNFNIKPLCLPVGGVCLDDEFCCGGLNCEGDFFDASCALPAQAAFGCFSGDMTVEGEDGGVIAMRDLKLGDSIKNADGQYDKVYSFGHYHPHVSVEFIRFQFEGAFSKKAPLEMTPTHMVFTAGNSAAIPASMVRVGDALLLSGGSSAAVVVQRIDTVTKQGVYAPFTESGTISVNQVAASSFVTLQDNSPVLQLSSSNYNSPFTWHWIAHSFEAPHRMICKYVLDCTSAETYNEVGLSSWVSGPHEVLTWLLEKNEVLFFGVMMTSLVLVMILRIVEILCDYKLLVALGSAATWFFYHHRRGCSKKLA